MSFKLVFFGATKPEGYGSKPHFIPTEMFDDATEELVKRFDATIDSVKDVTSATIDLPGMIMADRSYVDFDLGGFTLSIPTTDIDFYYKELQGKVRAVNGKQYYKLHGWIHCIMVTPKQRDAMLQKIEAERNAISDKAKAEDEEFDRRIASINAGGVKVLTPPRAAPIDKKMN